MIRNYCPVQACLIQYCRPVQACAIQHCCPVQACLIQYFRPVQACTIQHCCPVRACPTGHRFGVLAWLAVPFCIALQRLRRCKAEQRRMLTRTRTPKLRTVGTSTSRPTRLVYSALRNGINPLSSNTTLTQKLEHPTQSKWQINPQNTWLCA